MVCCELCGGCCSPSGCTGIGREVPAHGVLNVFSINVSDIKNAARKLKTNNVCGPDNPPGGGLY